MSDRNKRTLKTYNQNVDKYVEGTVQVTSGFQKEWLDSVFKGLPRDVAILEIGSGFGRDAQYLESKGYVVEVTDASVGFVEYLRSNGRPAKLLDIVNSHPDEKYDVILACAVFLHFTDTDFQQAVRNVRDSLLENGKFAFSVKLGDGDGWSSEKVDAPRYFNYYQPDELEKAIARAGMRVVDMQVYEDKWIHVVSQTGLSDGSTA